MGGNESKHLALLRILQIIEKYSDSNHPLKRNVIDEYLRKDYGICLERKAISNNISLLKEAGYDIVEVPHKGVYLAERLFSDEELKLLISDVYLSKYINEGQTKQIADKLKGLGGIYFRKSMASIYGTKKICVKKTKEIFETADIISRAIENNRKVKFTQNEYGVDKNLHAVSENIIVSPYQVISANDKYYLLCNIDGYDNITSFRLDKITELEELTNPRKDIRETKERGIRLERYISENPYMLDSNSEITRIYARVKIDKIGSVIDSFGDDFNVSEESLDTVDIDFIANSIDVLHWALYNSDCVEIKKPQSLRNELERLADKMGEVYGKNDTDRYRDIIADAKLNGELNIFRMKVAQSIKTEKLTNVNKITLFSTDVTDISFISECDHINELRIVDCPVADLSCLAGEKDIKLLDVRLTAISSIDFLQGMALDELVLGGNNLLNDYEPLYNMKNLANITADSVTLGKIDKDRLRAKCPSININVDDQLVWKTGNEDISYCTIYKYPYNVLAIVFGDFCVPVDYSLPAEKEKELIKLLTSIYNKKFSEEMKSVVKMLFQQGFTIKKIMKNCGFTQATVESYLANILMKLRHPSSSRLLAKYLPEDGSFVNE